jgi:hypothetical protein
MFPGSRRLPAISGKVSSYRLSGTWSRWPGETAEPVIRFSCRMRSTTARGSDRGATRRAMSQRVSPAPTWTTAVFAGTSGAVFCPIQPKPLTTISVTTAAASSRVPGPGHAIGERTASAVFAAEASIWRRAEQAEQTVLCPLTSGAKGGTGVGAAGSCEVSTVGRIGLTSAGASFSLRCVGRLFDRTGVVTEAPPLKHRGKFQRVV